MQISKISKKNLLFVQKVKLWKFFESSSSFLMIQFNTEAPAKINMSNRVTWFMKIC